MQSDNKEISGHIFNLNQYRDSVFFEAIKKSGIPPFILEIFPVKD